MHRTFVVLLLALSVMASDRSGQTTQGGFVMRVGADTVVTERFAHRGETLRGSINVKGQPRQEYVAVLGTGDTVRTLTVRVFDDATPAAAPTRQVVVTMTGDSAIADVGGSVQRFGTAPGAIPLVNNSFALAELFTRRARAAGGSMDIPAWALSGGSTFTLSLRAIGRDSMTLSLGGVTERLRVDAAGRILGGVIPSQGIVVSRTDVDLPPSAPAGPTPRPAGLIERDIVVPGPVPLPGTLTLPAGKGPFPAVVLVHGSGAGDRDETILGNKPFRDIAWGLAQQGVAVLRYDKRAHVQPNWYANRNFTVYDETTQDALSALALVRKQPEVNPRKCFVVGHSLGAMLAPRIATADPEIAGLVILAGATRMPLAEQMERQYIYLQSVAGADSGAVKALREKLAPSLARIRALKAADTLDARPIPGMGGTGTRYWYDLTRYDPAHVMHDLHKPALVMIGLRDYQVPPDQAADWLRVVGPRADVTVKRYPALTHLFIAGSGTPRPDEYATPGHVDTRMISDLAAWIKQH